MIDTPKRVDVRYGDFACSIVGFDDPVQPLRQVLRTLQRVVEETPEFSRAVIQWDGEVIETLLAQVARRTGIATDALAILPGLVIVHGPGSSDPSLLSTLVDPDLLAQATAPMPEWTAPASPEPVAATVLVSPDFGSLTDGHALPPEAGPVEIADAPGGWQMPMSDAAPVLVTEAEVAAVPVEAGDWPTPPPDAAPSDAFGVDPEVILAPGETDDIPGDWLALPPEAATPLDPAPADAFATDAEVPQTPTGPDDIPGDWLALPPEAAMPLDPAPADAFATDAEVTQTPSGPDDIPGDWLALPPEAAMPLDAAPADAFATDAEVTQTPSGPDAALGDWIAPAPDVSAQDAPAGASMPESEGGLRDETDAYFPWDEVAGAEGAETGAPAAWDIPAGESTAAVEPALAPWPDLPPAEPMGDPDPAPAWAATIDVAAEPPVPPNDPEPQADLAAPDSAPPAQPWRDLAQSGTDLRDLAARFVPDDAADSARDAAATRTPPRIEPEVAPTVTARVTATGATVVTATAKGAGPVRLNIFEAARSAPNQTRAFVNIFADPATLWGDTPAEAPADPIPSAAREPLPTDPTPTVAREAAPADPIPTVAREAAPADPIPAVARELADWDQDLDADTALRMGMAPAPADAAPTTPMPDSAPLDHDPVDERGLPDPVWATDAVEPAAPLADWDAPPPGPGRFDALINRLNTRPLVGVPDAPEPRAAPDLGEQSTRASDLAAAVGAETVPDLLASAAAWLTLVEDKPRFTRRDVMAVFDTLPGEHPKTLEARIKGYGKLVRAGQLVLVDDGLFALSQAERDRFAALID